MRPRTGPALPQSLLEEIGGSPSNAHSHEKSAHRKLSRKEARKQGRSEQKQRKVEFYSSSTTNTKRSAEKGHESSPPRKKPRLDSHHKVAAPRKVEPSRANTTEIEDSKKLIKSPLPHSRKPSKVFKSVDLPLSRQDGEEDRYIAYLEAKLGWSKGGKRAKGYGKELEDDGLDELLKDLDNIESSTFGQQLELDDTSVELSSSEEDSEIEVSTSGSEDLISSADSDTENVGEWHGFSEELSPQRSQDGAILENEDVHSPSSDKPLVPGSRYVPPHLRNREGSETSQESEAAVKLTRLLKGLLNRMSEQNIGTILESVEEVYRSHRRHDVTSTITRLIIDGISFHSILLDSYVVLHAAFVSALHKLVGIEFAAHFVQNVVASYESAFRKAESWAPSPDNQEEDTQGKECSNLVILLSELYNFHVVSCVLVYDIIRRLLGGDLSEIKVELLLKVARNSGYQLRSDDPSTLKNIIQIVHSKLPEEPNALSSRTRFMIETLTNLKNNKTKRNASQAGGSDTAERLRKFVTGLNKKRHVMAHEPLRVTLSDLHNAESKGKWWLVGAAWGGDPLVDRQKNTSPLATEITKEDKLYKLAKKQGMNTEIRRNIFIVLMSSGDYVNAHEKLTRLKLTEVQQREIVRVVLHCCGNEKAYNPYYTLIVQQLCRTSQNHRFTLQYCLWDFLRDLGETNVGGAEVIKNLQGDATGEPSVKGISTTKLKNLAKAFAWWIAKDCCSLAVLKPVDFTILKPQTRGFLVELFAQILMNTQVSTPIVSSDVPNTRNRGPIEEVFIQATKITALALGLIYFLGEGTKKEFDRAEIGSQFLTWANKVALDTLRTGMDVIPNL